LRQKLRRRGRAEPGYLLHVDERFGRYEGSVEPGALWVHAVSLGETRTAAIVIDKLRQLKPDIRILLTHGTATGRAEGERILRDGDMQAWLPWDTPKAVRGFLNHFRPCAGMLVETEMWPNVVAECRARGVPLVLANARLSPKSLKQTLRLEKLARSAYGSLTAVWAQTDGDAQRLARAGAPVEYVFGNVKFDATPNAQQLAQGREWRASLGRPVVMFASSREGEEAEFFSAIRESKRNSKADVQWLVVPRHPQRFDEVAQLAQQSGVAVSRRSEWKGSPQAAPLWLGDSLGEMALYYGIADVALLGGSFEKHGGQNLIEAAACGCPVVMGPHTFNFDEAAQLSQEAGAAFRVAGMPGAVDAAIGLATDRTRHAEAVDAARAFASAHQGAALKTAQALLQLITA